MNIKTIIVDDEPHARRYLSELLSIDEDIYLLDSFKNGREALSYIFENQVDLVFLDIHMPGINGLEVIQQLPEKRIPFIIFTTAYDQYAINAFEASAFDYILKPFDLDRLNKATEKVKEQLKLRKQASFHQKLKNLYYELEEEQSEKRTAFILKEKGFENKVKVRDILWIEASSVYVELHTRSKRYLYRTSLNALEEELPEHFLRIHRSFIINTQALQKTTYLNNNTYRFSFENGQSITSSRSYKRNIMTRFKK